MTLQPATLDELQQIVQEQSALVIRGGGSKPALSTGADDASTLDTSQIQGLIEYEPGEYTFTAYAGTLVRDIAAALSEHGQYLPFDPLLLEQGATLGGTVAANSAGSGRYRYGGVRDFILGVRFVDGQGQLVRGGGKVVKNAAGFDLPKFFVGSLGRYGVLAELSFKVFPQPAAYQTLKFTYPDLQTAMNAVFCLATSPLEMDVLDLEPAEGGQTYMLVRLGGMAAALPGRMQRLQSFLAENAPYNEAESITEDMTVWQAANALAWVSPGHSLVKIPLAPRQVVELDSRLAAIHVARRYAAAGNIAWVAADAIPELESILNAMQLAGLQLTGAATQPVLGTQRGMTIVRRMKQVLDPHGKFPANAPEGNTARL